ncbi:hypothetical protein HNR53_001139 [Bacillus benzoevorans]|uniref:Uncharacterized protein n=1 Tax=Bacillus benzoevorans TaxID=1456 RepID=A0A7X0HS15_9BACI|nr:hypothetical protein [Bacillus benzoevorans]
MINANRKASGKTIVVLLRLLYLYLLVWRDPKWFLHILSGPNATEIMREFLGKPPKQPVKKEAKLRSKNEP